VLHLDKWLFQVEQAGLALSELRMLPRVVNHQLKEAAMPVILWLLGVPLSLILVLWLVGVF
jgi:hypothetical protein